MTQRPAHSKVDRAPSASAAPPSSPEPLPAPPAGNELGLTVATLTLVLGWWVWLFGNAAIEGGRPDFYWLMLGTGLLMAAWYGAWLPRVDAARVSVAIYAGALGLFAIGWALIFPSYIRDFSRTPGLLLLAPALVVNAAVLVWLAWRNLRYRHLCHLHAQRARAAKV